jgi:hypothetical protein
MKKIIFALLIVCALLILPVSATNATYDDTSLYMQTKQIEPGTWDQFHDATSSNSVGAAGTCGAAIAAYGSGTGNWWRLTRGVVSFNTNIGPTNEFTSAILSIYVSVKTDELGGNVDVVTSWPATPTSLVNDDFDQYGTNTIGSIDITNLTASAWNNITITDLSVLDTTGYTTLGVRISNDVDDIAPEWIGGKYAVAYFTDAKLYVSYGGIPTIPPTANYEVIVSGLDTEPIEDANVSIWYNGAYQDSELTFATGSAYFVVPPYRFVNGTVTLSGYQTAYFDTYVYPSGSFEIVTLYTDDETPGSGDEYWNYIVTFRDASTLEQITNVFIDVYTDSGRTDLFTSENSPSGVWTGILPNDTIFYFTASAANHITANWSYTLSGASVSVYKDLIPVTYGSLQPVLNIFVYDTGGTALKDVGITVDSDIDDGFHLTNITGYARHFCDNLAHGSHRDYTITAEKGGYVTESSSVNVSTQQPTVYIFLEKSTVATLTPTGIYTPVVTPVWSGDGGTPGNIKEQLINTIMTQFGVSQLEANILMGIILTLLCAVVVGGGLASYGSGSGAGVGAMIGAVVGFSGSSIMGFFPIWILIVVIVLVFAAWFMFRGRDE